MISFREPPAGSRGSDEHDLGTRLYEELQSRLSPREFETWFQGTPCSFRSPDLFVLTTRNKFHRAWIKKEYSGLVLSAARTVCGFEPQIVYQHTSTVTAAPSSSPESTTLNGEHCGSEQRSRRSSPLSVHEASSPPLRENTFDSFVVGKGSCVAHAAALAVADQPGTTYNPLYIYGDTGLGKTHLAHAIYHRVASSASVRQIYAGAETFTNQFTSAVERRTLDDFRNRYRNMDVLILEDIQFLSTKSKTQEEFFHTIRALLLAERQVIMTGNCAPDRLKGLNERLAACFDGGLAAHLTAPDVDTRLRVLYQKARLRNFELPLKTAHFIATNVCSNLRELEGVLKYLVNLAHLHNCPPTLEMGAEALSAILTQKKPYPLAISVNSILKAVQDYYEVKQRDLLSSSKVRSLVHARQVGMYLARELTPLSLEQIGLHFGGKDHTTVLYALKIIDRHRKKNAQLRTDLEILRSRLSQSHSL